MTRISARIRLVSKFGIEMNTIARTLGEKIIKQLTNCTIMLTTVPNL